MCVFQDKSVPPRTVTVEDKEAQREKDKDRDRERDKEKDKIKESDKENEPENDRPTDVGSVSDATSPPPRGSLTPRIADMVQTDALRREADKENERHSGLATDAKSVPRKPISEDGITKGGETEVGLYIWAGDGWKTIKGRCIISHSLYRIWKLTNSNSFYCYCPWG